MTPRPEQDDRREKELNDPGGLRPDAALDHHVKGRYKMRAHLEDEDREGEHRCKQDIAPQSVRLFRLAFHPGLAGVCFCNLRRVADGRGGRHEVPGRYCPFEILDHRRLGGQIHSDRHHTGKVGKRLVHPSHAGRTRHGRDVQGDLRRPGRIAQCFQRFRSLGQMSWRLDRQARSFRGKIDGDAGHALQPRQSLFNTAHAGGTGHALYAQRFLVSFGHGGSPQFELQGEYRASSHWKLKGSSEISFGDRHSINLKHV